MKPANIAQHFAIQKVSRLLHLDIPEVWVRFLLAIVGLVLAFGAALFSTVSRESGNRWATVLLASTALVLAVVVGLTTVPYLARRVAGAGIRYAFDFDVTKVGIVYVAIVLLIGIAALNTGNNLLYIVVAAMLAAILVSGIASAMVLRNLELDVRLPEHVFAGRPMLGRIALHNQGRWLPSFSVNVVAVEKDNSGKHWQWVPAKFAVPPGRPPERQWLQFRDYKLQRVSKAAVLPSIFEGATYFPYVPAGTELTADIELRFERRGCYQQKSFGLATRFPFAFLTKTRRVPLAREIIVYPRVEPADEFFEVLPMITGEFESFVRGRGDDLYLIREYMPEDSARHVDWKATAKSGGGRSGRRRGDARRRRRRRCRVERDRPQCAIGDVLERHRQRLGRAVDRDVAEELQSVAGGEVIALLLAGRLLKHDLRAKRAPASAPASRSRHGAGRRRIPRTARNRRTPRGSDRSNAPRCSAGRR